ncbi:ribonuclease H-like domain-containing protein [Gymnopilus junonius]|uniref:ribonuclease H n=1 Tax=Gymnopilus junonius TaxID=109634 RepID=A0A9P5NFK6_GYMJU|nr:ribonuclease H-like domain-containing protein [Gymnopilus junonius]
MNLPKNQYVEDRQVVFCPSLARLEVSELIVECHNCHRYFAACCLHSSFGGDLYEPEKSHCEHGKLVFTDGACSNNGSAQAKAGLGISIGGEGGLHDHSWSISVDDSVDFEAPRTNQRAELLAAIEGLNRLELASQHDVSHGHKPAFDRQHTKEDRATYVVVTDSEYVVKGITEWFPSWRKRGWRTSDGKRPTNLDLFMRLDDFITTLEEDRVVVGFWRVPRAFNHAADALAKRAVKS